MSSCNHIAQHFVPFTNKDGLELLRCIPCEKYHRRYVDLNFPNTPSENWTSVLTNGKPVGVYKKTTSSFSKKYHLEQKHPECLRQSERGDIDGCLEQMQVMNQVDEETLHNQIFKMIKNNSLPISFIDDQDFRDLITLLRPRQKVLKKDQFKKKYVKIHHQNALLEIKGLIDQGLPFSFSIDTQYCKNTGIFYE